MVLGRHVSNEDGQSFVQAVELTEDHKPDNPIECRRINEAGGRVDRLVSGKQTVVTTYGQKLALSSCMRGFLFCLFVAVCCFVVISSATGVSRATGCCLSAARHCCVVAGLLCYCVSFAVY